MKPRVYVETSVVSYLTARPSRDLALASRQQSSLQLWEAQDRYELIVSDLVYAEASAGDDRAAEIRLAWLSGLQVLAVEPEATEVADALIAAKALPESAYADALHIGIAATNQMAVIASWNFRHIASVWARARIEAALQGMGYSSCRIATPDELTEGDSQ